MTIVIWCAHLTQAQMVSWSQSDCFVVFITIIIMISIYHDYLFCDYHYHHHHDYLFIMIIW